MWRDLGVATALVLVIEGLLPFVNPQAMKKAYAAMAQMDRRTLRIGGLASMGLGLIILQLVN